MATAIKEFSTKRFDIFSVQVERNPAIGAPRWVYMAWHHSEDVPHPVCTVTIWGSWVEWVETISECRRDGIATEVVRGLEEHFGEPLNMSGATDAGTAFCDAFERKFYPEAASA